jgi:hypothetical protein
MNKKILIPIFIIITMSLIASSFYEKEVIEEKTLSHKEVIGYEINSKTLSQKEIIEEKTLSQKEVIEERLDEIEKDRITNEQSMNPYYAEEREWIQSGPFMIDRSEYLIGEKIFINIVDLNKNEKGEIIFFKFLNNTHVLEYKKIGFDGAIKQNSNIYVSIQLKNELGLCTADQLVGNWGILFTGVSTKDLEFKIKDRIIPGIEDQFEPVC